MVWRVCTTDLAPENLLPMAPRCGVECWPCCNSPRRRACHIGMDRPWLRPWARAFMRSGTCFVRRDLSPATAQRCVSTDPEFALKAGEVIGLYLNPLLNALVLS